jgi:hypothetical protein
MDLKDVAYENMDWIHLTRKMVNGGYYEYNIEPSGLNKKGKNVL